MTNSNVNKQALDKYQHIELVHDYYVEPVGENFWQYISRMLAGIGVGDEIFSIDKSDINEQHYHS